MLSSLVAGQPVEQAAALDQEEGPAKGLRIRRWATVGAGSGIVAGTLVALDRAWYAQYDRSRFHGFDDGREWLQMDKVGHAFATYTVGEWGYGLMHWCKYPERASIWLGGGVGLLYLSAVEWMDGRSAEWGFSGWDMAANVAGTGLFIGQQAGWGEQRIRLKYSAHLTSYALQRPEVLGSGTPERILKDYNGSTIWLSAVPHAFGWKVLPPWLGVAIGYGGEGMLYANGTPGDRRQFYFAPDIDLTRLQVKGKVLRTVLFTLNCIKIPAPTLEFDGARGWRAHALYF